MNTIIIILQIVIAAGIFNVWLLRFSQPSEWRGGNASNMKEEFEVYGLPPSAVRIVGLLKLACAALLIVGIWMPCLVTPAAGALAVLMLGAVIMHIKVKDPLKKSLPAFVMLVLCLVVANAHCGACLFCSAG
jgi:uncharacterized membrane protein YphA (DoxX/SURF4 family)